MNNSCQPCIPKIEVFNKTPAKGAPIIVDNNSEVSIKEVARALSFGVNQRGNNTE